MRACVIDRKTQLVARNKKLVLIDTETYRLFMLERSMDMIEQSILFQLCHEFIKISRAMRYSLGNLKSLPTFIREVFSLDSHLVLNGFSAIALDTLYYVAGWIIHAANKVASKRIEEVHHCLVYFVNSVSIVDPTAENKCGLPTGKVDRLIRYGGLKYANFQFFQFVARLEMVYSNILSEEYIVAIGLNRRVVIQASSVI